MTTKDNIINQIRCEFSLAEPPAIVVEHQDGLLANAKEHPYSDPLKAIRAFSGRSWQEITPAYANSRYDEVSSGFYHLTPEAFRYYLPALLILSVDASEEDLQAGDSEWATQLAQLLDPKSGRNEFFESRFRLLNNRQKSLIARVLVYIKETYTELGYPGITSNCEAYWHQFDPNPLPRPAEQDPS